MFGKLHNKVNFTRYRYNKIHINSTAAIFIQLLELVGLLNTFPAPWLRGLRQLRTRTTERGLEKCEQTKDYKNASNKTNYYKLGSEVILLPMRSVNPAS